MIGTPKYASCARNEIIGAEPCNCRLSAGNSVETFMASDEVPQRPIGQAWPLEHAMHRRESTPLLLIMDSTELKHVKYWE